MTVFAGIGRLDMGDVLTGGIEAVVTGEAVPRDIGVIEHSRHPCGRRMAVVASVARGDVSQVFPGCLAPIVTSAAAAGHCRMIHIEHRAPG